MTILRCAIPLVLGLATAGPAHAQDRDRGRKPDAARGAQSPDDLVREADARLAAGDVTGAVDLLRKASAQGTDGAVGLRLGRALEAAHELDGAIDAYRAAAATLDGPPKGEALGRLALAEEARGFGTASASAQAAAAADPAGPFPLVALARLRAREGRADEAASLAAQGAGAGPAAQAAAGRAEEARGDWAAAEAAYRGAGGAEAKDVLATTGLARALRRTGRAAEAAPLLETLLATYPGAVAAYKESARVKMATGRADEAFGDASTAAALAEDDPDAQSVVQEAAAARALAYVARNQPDLAIQDLTAFQQRQGDGAAVRVALGRAQAAMREADAALAEFAKAIELDPTLAEAHYHAGQVRQMMKKDVPGAVAAFEKAAALDPSNAEYRTTLGGALIQAGQLDRAIEELGKVTAEPSYTRADAWMFLGAAHLGKNRFKDAVAALEKAAAIAPGQGQIEAYLAWSHFGLKDAEKFKAHGSRARSLGAADSQLLERLKRVEAGEAIR